MIQNAVLREQIWVDKSEITQLEKVKHTLTLRPIFKNLKPVPTFKETDTQFGFPRGADIEIANIDDQTNRGMEVGVSFVRTLRPYQESLANKFLSKLEDGQTQFILEADTGSGKTVMMINWWTFLNTTLLIVVPKSDLVNQWKEALLKFTNLRESDIGLARQNVCDYRGRKVVIGMLQSLYKDKYPQEFKDYFGCVIFDELHKLGAHFFSRVGGMFASQYRIGGTATLKRPDGLTQVFLYHLGNDKIRLTERTQPRPKIAVFRYAKSSGRLPGWCRDLVQRRAKLISMLAANKERTAAICDMVTTLVGSDRQTLVVSERTQHLKDMRNVFVKGLGWKKEDVGLYIGATKDAERKRIAKESKLIFATTNMLTLGTDIPTLRALVLATPMKEVAQAVGRIVRTNPDLKDPLLVDIIDSQYVETNRWFNARLSFYRKKGCEVSYVQGA